MKRVAVLALVGLLAGCGPSLDDYEITEVKVVENLAKAVSRPRDGEGYLRVDLASDFDLLADTNGNVYAFASFCPFTQDDERMVIGPLAASDPPVDLLDMGEAMPRDETGRAHYVIYVPLAELQLALPSDTGDAKPSGDLPAAGEDLCLQIRQSGYYLTDSASDTIRIPVNQWQAALRNR